MSEVKSGEISIYWLDRVLTPGHLSQLPCLCLNLVWSEETSIYFWLRIILSFSERAIVYISKLRPRQEVKQRTSTPETRGWRPQYGAVLQGITACTVLCYSTHMISTCVGKLLKKRQMIVTDWYIRDLDFTKQYGKNKVFQLIYLENLFQYGLVVDFR